MSQLTGVSGRTQVPSAELDASGKLNASAEQMAAALKAPASQKWRLRRYLRSIPRVP
ncbi:hypothetical protein PCI56_10945 [Plesiomonas shigelloides subsp. oncorhynchi]|nr:hypothetical protein [Plesiomonas shigelloides]